MGKLRTAGRGMKLLGIPWRITLKRVRWSAEKPPTPIRETVVLEGKVVAVEGVGDNSALNDMLFNAEIETNRSGFIRAHVERLTREVRS